VADHRLRLQSPLHQQPRQRVFDDEDRRVREAGLVQPIGASAGLRTIAMQNFAEIETPRLVIHPGPLFLRENQATYV
jgi:hypothetical protein